MSTTNSYSWGSPRGRLCLRSRRRCGWARPALQRRRTDRDGVPLSIGTNPTNGTATVDANGNYVDTPTAAGLERVAVSPANPGPQGVTVSPDGRFVFVTNFNRNGDDVQPRNGKRQGHRHRQRRRTKSGRHRDQAGRQPALCREHHQQHGVGHHPQVSDRPDVRVGDVAASHRPVGLAPLVEDGRSAGPLAPPRPT